MSPNNRVTAAHGMGTDPVAPSWPSLTPHELSSVFTDYAMLQGDLKIGWISPRPFSSAALVKAGDQTVFVKRHHASVRTPAELAPEHGFIQHLGSKHIPVPHVLETAAGATAVSRGDWTYELHTVAVGADLYRDALSWTPFQSVQHAESAGALLGRMHVAAEDFTAPARPYGQLISRYEVLPAADPIASLAAVVAQRPRLAAALATRPWEHDFEQLVLPWSARLPPLEPLWTHNDLHASNLLFSATGAASAVIDFGLANRTTAIFDLATALERNTVAWLDLARGQDPDVELGHVQALIAGYLRERDLTEPERQALIELLPIVHVEFALSELEYFHGITRSPRDADLAYDGYFVGHLEWFGSPRGQRYLAAVRQAAS